MSRVFAYCRVSKKESATGNQVREIGAAGFALDKRRIVEETISGASAIALRPEFAKLLDRLEESDVLVVTKLDRLGRDVIDVATTVKKLKEMGVRVYCLQLGGADLTSAAGEMTMNVLLAVAQFERDLIIERTNAGLERACGEGKKSGRKAALNDIEKVQVRARIDAGIPIAQIARDFDVSRQTVLRAKGAAA